jgi:hypothetical protein
MRNVSDKICRNIKTRILYSITFLFDIRAVYETMWKNIVEPGRPQITIWRMPFAWWTPKTTNTSSE